MMSMLENVRFCFIKVSKKSKQQLAVFQEGKRLIEKELQVEKLVKDLRDIKIIIKNHFHHEFKEDLLYHPRNCIDLDEISGQLEGHRNIKSRGRPRPANKENILKISHEG